MQFTLSHEPVEGQFTGATALRQAQSYGLIWASLILSLLLTLITTSAHAQTFPPIGNHRVVDTAALLAPDQSAALEAKLAGIEAATGHQLVVATIPSLGGYDIADYGYRLGRAWGIGKKGTNDGVVLLVAKADRKLRIEVGYGLEPILTDALSSVIINTTITPYFKSGDYAGGINAGVDAIAAQIKLPPDEARARAVAAAKPASNGSASIGSIIFWIVLIIFFVLPMMRRAGGGRRYGGGLGQVILWSMLDSATRGRGGGSGFGGGGGFSGGGGSFGGGGASGGW